MAVLKPIKSGRVIPPHLYSISVTVHPTPTETHTHREPPSSNRGDCLPAWLSLCLLTGCGRSHLACWMSRSACAVLVITLHSRRSGKSSPQMASARQRGVLAGEKKKERDKKKDTNKHLFPAPVNWSPLAPVVMLFKVFYSFCVCVVF